MVRCSKISIKVQLISIYNIVSVLQMGRTERVIFMPRRGKAWKWNDSWSGPVFLLHTLISYLLFNPLSCHRKFLKLQTLCTQLQMVVIQCVTTTIWSNTVLNFLQHIFLLLRNPWIHMHFFEALSCLLYIILCMLFVTTNLQAFFYKKAPLSTFYCKKSKMWK